MAANSILIQVLKSPSNITNLSLKDWDLVVRQARSARLVASLYYLFLDNEVLNQVPKRVLNHLESASKQAQKTVLSAKWELGLISTVVSGIDCPVIVLKGAAYARLGFLNSRGRIFSDIDLLVPEERIKDVENAFLKAGWVSDKLDSYDQEYYRKWMHELPPMRNTKTGVSLDLHHSILPKTASIKVNAKKLILNSKLLNEEENLYVFSEEDMFLHSAVHLFHEGEFEHGLRDLVDLEYMAKTFSENDSSYTDRLIERANELNMGLPLYYAIRYCRLILHSEYAQDFLDALEQFKPRNIALMDSLFMRALKPDHKSCDDWFTSKARWMLYVRSHYLRMPFYLLIPHLVRKAYKRRFDDTEKVDAN